MLATAFGLMAHDCVRSLQIAAVCMTASCTRHQPIVPPTRRSCLALRYIICVTPQHIHHIIQMDAMAL